MLPSAEIQCPYCGESIEVLIDNSADDQRYIEDCQVCCRPIFIAVMLRVAQVIANAESGA
jgi:Cysteine-rich CPXCG